MSGDTGAQLGVIASSGRGDIEHRPDAGHDAGGEGLGVATLAARPSPPSTGIMRRL